MTRLTQAEQYIFNDIGIKTDAFTAAVTNICSTTAHGLKNGDMVVLTTTTTLPAGLELATIYYVEKIDADTFYLSATNGGARVDITDTGTGTHTWTMRATGVAINCEKYTHAVISVDTDGGGNAAMTVKFQHSIAETCPDFSAAQSASNRWDYLRMTDLEDGSSTDGDTGFVVNVADDHRVYEAEINHTRWLCASISGWTNGEVNLKVKLASNT